MHSADFKSNQRGIALVVAMLFLLVVTLLAVTAARDSSFSLKMSGNLQDQYSSMQWAEAGAFGTLALTDPNNPDNPLADGISNDDPFAGVSSNPLAHLDDPNDVRVRLTRTDSNIGTDVTPCPRSGSSTEDFVCQYFRIDAEHERAQRARTRVSLGVVRTIPNN